MTTIDLIQSAPQAKTVDAQLIAAAIDALNDCATSCVACASACLSEESVAMMATCIRDDLDCADLCTATARVLARLNSSDRQASTSLLAACIEACVQCATSCGEHRDHHEHCRLCEQACLACEAACQALLDAVRAA